MRYGKLDRGVVIYATSGNPDELLAQGYLPIKQTEIPEAPNKCLKSVWKEAEGKIVQSWEEVTDPILPESEPTIADVIQSLSGKAPVEVLAVISSMVNYTQAKFQADIQASEDKTMAIACSGFFPPWERGKYTVGDVRTDAGKPYECIQNHDSTVNTDWTIKNRALWKPYHSRDKEWALPWEAPTGAHDMYKNGEYMIWTDGSVYQCVQDTNFSPVDYPAAWKRTV